MAYRVNGQYIIEGLESSFLFTKGGLGFIILDWSNASNIPKLNRSFLLFIEFVCVLLRFFVARVFMRMKLLAIWWVNVLFEKKSMDTGFVLFNEVLKAVPILWYEIWKRMRSSRKEASSRKHGKHIKAQTRISSWYQKDKLIAVYYPADLYWHTSDVEWHFLLRFWFLKENTLHFYKHNIE